MGFLRKLFLSAIFVFFAVNTFAATYYIDYNAANDSANGTSTDTPWKRSPGMVGFAGSYSHSNGDVFVFKGGVTWPYVSGDAILTIGYSGADGTEDVYAGGNNPTYNYGDGTNAIFDVGNTASASYGIYGGSTRSNLKIRYFTVQNLRHTTGSGQAVVLNGSNWEFDHNYISPNSINCLAWSPNTGTFTKLYIHHNTFRQCGRVNMAANNTSTTDIRFYNNTYEGAWDYDPVTFHTDGLMFGGDGLTDYAIKGLYIYNNKFWGDWRRGATAQIYLNGTSSGCYSFTNGSHEPTHLDVLFDSVHGNIFAGQFKVYTVTLTSGAWDGSGVGTICGNNRNWTNGATISETPSYGGQTVGVLSSSVTNSSLLSTQNTYIWNNLLLTSNETPTGSAGASDKGIKITSGHDNINIFNNTIDHSSDTRGGSSCIEYYNFISNVSIKNNICNGFLDGSVYLSDIQLIPVTGTHEIDYNIYKTGTDKLVKWLENGESFSSRTCSSAHTSLGAVFPNTKCSIADPLFTTNIIPADAGSPYYSMSNGDLTLQATSYGVGNGADLSAIEPFATFGSTDYNGATRTTWDIGARAYGATVGDTTPPTVTSGIIQAAGNSIIFVFSEQITSTSGAAFTLDTSGAAIALTCPAVTSANTMTCATDRTIQQNETSPVFGYSGSKVTDIATNALATITSQAGTNNSTVQTPPTYTLTITASHCSVINIPLGTVFQADSVVTIYPTCHSGHQDVVYSGDCSTNSVTMSANKACTVTCTAIPVLPWVAP